MRSFHLIISLPLLGILACKPQTEKSKVQSEVTSATIASTACVALQGNGSNFSSHVGTYIAILEKNILPKISIGGSPGAIVASAVMGLLENPSVVSLPMGPLNLTTTQKAAFLLAASQDVFDSFLFLPALNDIGAVFVSSAKFLFSTNVLNKNDGSTDAAIVHMESTIGQAVALADFLKNTDFSAIFDEKNYSQRRAKIKELWLKHTDAIAVTPRELVHALTSGKAERAKNPKLEEINRRYFEIFREDKNYSNQPDPIKARESYNNNLELTKLLPVGNFRDGFLSFMSSQKAFGADKWAKALDKPFLFPNPDVLFKAYQGTSRDDKTIPIPNGMVIHSTMRKADLASGKPKETEGWNNLYISYFPANNLIPQFKERLTKSFSNEQGGFLPYKKAGNIQLAVAPENILIINSKENHSPQGLALALKVTASEPGSFRRDAFALASTDFAKNHTTKSTFFGSGGWHSANPIPEVEHLSECKDADFFVESTLPGPINTFVQQALRGVVGVENFDKFHEVLNEVVAYARTKSGKIGLLSTGLNWDEPSRISDPAAKKLMHEELKKNRISFAMLGYQYMNRSLSKFPTTQTTKSILPWGQPLTKEVDMIASVEELNAFTAMFSAP